MPGWPWSQPFMASTTVVSASLIKIADDDRPLRSARSFDRSS